MKQFFLILILFALTQSSISAQFQDNFADGNFTQNPEWLGDTANFIINTNNELQLNALTAGNAQLYVEAPTSDSTIWEFYFKMDFSPSSGNQLKIYLASDNSDFSSNLNGYFLQIGESGTNDALEFYRQDGNSETLLLRGTDAALGGNSAIASVRIIRDENDNWTILADYSGGNNYISEGSIIDGTYQFGQYFGIQCQYTSTRIDKFFFDNFFINPLYFDTDAPELSQITVESANEISLLFNESIDIITASDITNYTVNNGIGNPNQAIIDANDNRKVNLLFNNNFQDGLTNQIQIINIEDEEGNAITSESVDFTYIEVETATIYDIIINEIFADPTPSIGLPEVEFIEIYNRSNKNFSLENYTFWDNTNTIIFPNETLQAGEYAIICDLDEVDLFTSFGKVIGLENFPSLTNGGELLQIRNENNELIDAVEYDDNWYGTDKDNGGWTLERIFINQPCLSGSENWSASENLIGGTPGTENSIVQFENDEIAPILLDAFPDSINRIRLIFNEQLDINTAENSANYSIDNNVNITNVTLEFPNNNTVLLELSNDLIESTIYTITVQNIVNDCIGNSFSSTENVIQTAIPSEIEIGYLLINEILFNPQTGGNDFVEIYNHSDKVLNLNDLNVGSANDGLIDVLEPIEIERLIFPNEYIVLTENELDIKSRYETDNPNNFIETDLPSYPDDEGGVVLVANGEIIDRFDYSKDFHFELIDDVNGVSLERINFDASTNDKNNWNSAASTVGYATPTYQNSQFRMQIENENQDKFWLEKTSFSPNNDGFEDALIINYELETGDYVATIKIFDSEGRLIKNLISNELLATEGIVKWEGLTSDNTKARIGIYIVHIQYFLPDGTVSEERKTCVLAGDF